MRQYTPLEINPWRENLFSHFDNEFIWIRAYKMSGLSWLAYRFMYFLMQV